MLTACKKETVQKKDPPPDPVTKTEMLSAVTWVYYEYFINYNQNNTTLAYKAYKPNNLYDLSKCRLKYNADGSYEETLETGEKVTGTWKFIENETKIELNVNERITTIKINYVAKTSFEWTSIDGNILGRMKPL
jgi:hypothetical protein